MEKFTSEVLKSGVQILATEKGFYVNNGEDYVHLTKSDINRMHGIAFPEKRRTGECNNTTQEADVTNINVGDIPQTISGDKYEEHVREVAEEMARDIFTDFSERHLEQQERYINHFTGAARIAVRREAEAAKKALYHNAPDRNPLFVEKYLIERGLIRAPEVTPNVEHHSNVVPVSPHKEICTHYRINNGYCIDCGEPLF